MPYQMGLNTKSNCLYIHTNQALSPHQAPAPKKKKKKKKGTSPTKHSIHLYINCFATEACGDNYKMMTTKGQ